jgi:hypothetical protein
VNKAAIRPTLGQLKKLTLTMATSVASVLVMASPALAVQGIGISPTSQLVTIVPGGVSHGTLTAINDGDTTVTYHLYATDYGVSGESYKGVFTSASSNSNVSSATWFGLPAGNFKIAPQQEIVFPYTIAVPKNAVVGGHYAAVFIQTVPPVVSGGAMVTEIQRVGTLFYMTVSGNLINTGNLLPLEVPWLQSTPPVSASLRLTNTGNVHFLAQGTAELYSPFGKVVGSQVAFKGEVLPDTTRLFDLHLPESSPIGVFRVTANVNYLGNNMQESRWMLLIPKITFLIIAATLLLILVLGFWGFMHRIRRRKAKSAN